MKPAPFVHHAPTSVAEAVEVLREVGHDGKVLAGGQSLIPAMNMRLATPGHLVDINGLDDADAIEVDERQVRIGPLVRHERLRRDPAAYAALPLLRQALDHVAHPAIRHRGTTVGSITHADPAGEMLAVLALCDGVVEATGPSGTREIGWGSFFAGPMQTVLAPEELVTGIRFHRFAPGARTAFVEVARRHGDYALAGVALAVHGDVARAALVSVTDTPQVWELSGLSPAEAEEAVAESVSPEGDIHAPAEYRRMLAATLTRRALESLATPPPSEGAA